MGIANSRFAQTVLLILETRKEYAWDNKILNVILKPAFQIFQD